jgi:hypothetical protein
MAPHFCALLFKPRREDWAEVLNLALSSRWCARARDAHTAHEKKPNAGLSQQRRLCGRAPRRRRAARAAAAAWLPRKLRRAAPCARIAPAPRGLAARVPHRTCKSECASHASPGAVVAPSPRRAA